MVRRWHQLPLDHALRCVPTVRTLLADLAGDRAPLLPDLGPAVVMDQLTVLVFDVCTAGGPDVNALPHRLRGLLADLSVDSM